MLLGVALASVLGSLHCGAMCGGWVLLYGGTGGRHAAYHLGRLVGYAGLGAAAGFVGGQVEGATEAVVGVRRLVGPLLGVVLLLVASRAWRGAAVRGGCADCPAADGERKPGFRQRVGARPGMGPALAVGLFTALLPCGWLWSFLLLAGASGSAAHGGLVMAAFWAGTVPALAAVGGLTSWLRARFPQQRLVAVGLALAGLLAVFGQWAPVVGTASAADAAVCEHPRPVQDPGTGVTR